MHEVTIQGYFESKTDTKSKIVAINNLIDAMLTEALTAIGTSGTASYSMDDGQMKVTTEYRNMTQINAAIDGLEKIKQRYINRYNGSVVVLRGKLKY